MPETRFPDGANPIAAVALPVEADRQAEGPPVQHDWRSAESMESDQPVVKPKPGWFRRLRSWIARQLTLVFQVASLVVVLAVLTAIPILQLVSFGYLLDVAGRLTSGQKLSGAVWNLKQSGQIGKAILGLFLVSLPVQLLTHWESVASIINPGSFQADALRFAAVAAGVVGTIHLMWSMNRGGRLRHYLWPQPIRFLKTAWRPSTWSDGPDRLWAFVASLEIPRLFWLGLRGALGTLIWLVPAMIIIAANRNGETGLAGLVGALSLIALGLSLFYLPMLQANFAADNRIRSLFAVRTIRRDFRRAPWAWLAAMTFGLVLMPIPLYLLRIEATPQEVVWLLCLFFIGSMLPARIAEGLALRRARRRPEPTTWWHWISRWTARILMVPVVAIYLIFVQVSQYTSWDGLDIWVQQHAILIPVPFVGV